MFQRYFTHSHSASTGANLQKSGLLSFGSELRGAFSLEAGQRVELHYDPESKRIGIRPLELGQEQLGCAKITPLTRGLGISCRGLMNKFGIEPGKFSGSYDETESLIVLSREQPTP